jgi:hypothetical protein
MRVEDRRSILEAALNRGMEQTTIAQLRQEFERRVQAGEFIAVEPVGVGQHSTTATMLRMEREIIDHLQLTTSVAPFFLRAFCLIP